MSFAGEPSTEEKAIILIESLGLADQQPLTQPNLGPLSGPPGQCPSHQICNR